MRGTKMAHADDCASPLDDSHTECPFASNDSIPADEMLLAEALASWLDYPRLGKPLAVSIADHVDGGAGWQPARIGARDVLYGEESKHIVRDDDLAYYAAGAALAIAVSK
mgnify:CR=1 FL=1